jgi:hypothetical protein
MAEGSSCVRRADSVGEWALQADTTTAVIRPYSRGETGPNVRHDCRVPRESALPRGYKSAVQILKLSLIEASS